MGTRLIRLNDGAIVEIEDIEEGGRQISTTPTQIMEANLQGVEDILSKICEPIVKVWRKWKTEVAMDRVEVDLCLSFEGKGNVFIAQVAAGGNLKVKLVLRPQREDERDVSEK